MFVKPELKSAVRLEASTGRHVESCRGEMRQHNVGESGRVRGLEVELNLREEVEITLTKGDIV